MENKPNQPSHRDIPVDPELLKVLGSSFAHDLNNVFNLLFGIIELTKINPEANITEDLRSLEEATTSGYARLAPYTKLKRFITTEAGGYEVIDLPKSTE